MTMEEPLRNTGESKINASEFGYKEEIRMKMKHIILAKFIGSEFWPHFLLEQLLSRTAKPEMSWSDELDLMQDRSEMMDWTLSR